MNIPFVRQSAYLMFFGLIITSNVVIVSFPNSVTAKSEGELNPGMENPGHEAKPHWFKNSFLDFQEDVKEASGKGKRVMLYFYQDGCPYCKKLLVDNFGQREIAEKTQKYFDVVAVNIWGDREVIDFAGNEMTEKEFAAQQKVMFTPTLLLLDEQSQVALRINGYFAPNKFSAALDFVGGRHETELSFGEYLKNATPSAPTGKLHQQPNFMQAPYNFRQQLANSDKPLLVFFEQRQCKACDELHLDILQRPESQALLTQFDIALLDMWSDSIITTPKDKKISIEQWARDLAINYAPSMVFFDRKGEEIFRTEAYLKAFHVQSALDYVASKAYEQQSEFQRYIEVRADRLTEQGIKIDLMK